jgi:hypothetical protein
LELEQTKGIAVLLSSISTQQATIPAIRTNFCQIDCCKGPPLGKYSHRSNHLILSPLDSSRRGLLIRGRISRVLPILAAISGKRSTEAIQQPLESELNSAIGGSSHNPRSNIHYYPRNKIISPTHAMPIDYNAFMLIGIDELQK